MKFSDRAKKVRDKRVLESHGDRIDEDITISDILAALDEMAEEDAVDPYAHGKEIHTRLEDVALVRRVLVLESDACLSVNFPAALAALRRLARS